ncbi:hypothetical protein J6590_084521 [Homalodisca vitripennis]|nr:hypothetical protein J6590_084521 [Homalodisca vitripennis]
MDQIRQCMDNKEPSRVKYRRAEPDPPLLAVRLGSARLVYQFASVWRITDRTRAPNTEKSVHYVFTTADQTLRTTRSAKVRSSEYSNKFKRDTAWEHLLQITKEKIPNADTNFVKRKVDNLRAAFGKEMRKVRDSTRSGASADDTYTPTLWYFELMKFTAEQEQPRKTKSNLDEDEENIIEEEGSIVEEELNEGDVNNGDNEQTLNRGSPSTAATRRKTSPKKNKTKNDRAEE